MDEAKDSVTSIQVSDSEILTGSADCCLRRYDLRKGKMHCDFVGSKFTCFVIHLCTHCLIIFFYCHDTWGIQQIAKKLKIVY